MHCDSEGGVHTRHSLWPHYVMPRPILWTCFANLFSAFVFILSETVIAVSDRKWTMPTVAEKIREALGKSVSGAIVSARSLTHLGRRAVDQALARMSRAGELMRIARGMYVLPVKGKFGSYPPAAEKMCARMPRPSGEALQRTVR
ncbi:hypothetical protein EH240_27060 [Mesorhizobium tamadayense]|uniref:AbiEi antitoxin N-terminal domain-containing protein n=1 Tax=Mesorhizobium tamadayense TaxID=425306 RepID=A0A3P3F7J9_9HYPH|nr:type IV toxin-antitoxin system AbiEi family antitoxin domain-containing protein [Mesorhizobium tamadayense]RRH94525.1 hypothetical protein EH240_27060 [Mesorhizobium tamadayense]